MQFLVFTLVIFCFVKPIVGFWAFISFAAFLEISIVIANLSKFKVNNKNDKYNHKEEEIIRQYSFFFKFPSISRILSPTFSAIQISAVPLVPYFLYKSLYPQAFLIGINYIIASILAQRLNPKLSLQKSLGKVSLLNNQERQRASNELETIESALQKLNAENTNSLLHTRNKK